MPKGHDSGAGELGGEANSVLSLMGQMMRLPFTALIYSFEILVRTVRGMQRVADQGFETLTGDSGQNSNEPQGTANVSTITGGGADRNQQTTREEEESVMWDDQDLSGDDLKYVSYSILFTKRDLEATLEQETQDLVNYSTNGGSYGGLKIAHFMKKVAEGKARRPDEWKEPGNNYPPGASGDFFTSIPKDDERYITFIYRVDRRISRQEADYDKQKVNALKGIKSGIDDLSAKIGP